MDVIASCCFGSTINSQDPNDPFIQHAKELFNRNFSLVLLVMVVFPRLVEVLELSIFPLKCLTFFEQAVHNVVNLRRKQNTRRTDFLQLLLDAQNEEKKTQPKQKSDNWKNNKVLDENGLVANAILFLLAGFDTTSNTISFVLYLMALNPECQRKLIEEVDQTLQSKGELSHEVIMSMPYLEKVVSETLRLYPPALRLERLCTRDYKLDDKIWIRKGMMVSVGVYGIHMDPELYPQPDKFDPERFSPENKAGRHSMAYLPFGAGPRICIGMRFALMETKVALAYFFKDFTVSPCSKTEIPIIMRKAIPAMSPANGISLKVEARRNTS